MSGQNRADIQTGMLVEIVLKKDQRTGVCYTLFHQRMFKYSVRCFLEKRKSQKTHKNDNV